jgi:hypothetical protein
VNILKRDDDTLVGWNIDASDTSQNLILHMGPRCARALRMNKLTRVRWRPALAGRPAKRGPGEEHPQTSSFQAEKSWLADRGRRVNWPFPSVMSQFLLSLPGDIGLGERQMP